MRTIRLDNKGSRAQVALVDVQGVPAKGIIDTGAETTIMGAKLFKLLLT